MEVPQTEGTEFSQPPVSLEKNVKPETRFLLQPTPWYQLGETVKKEPRFLAQGKCEELIYMILSLEVYDNLLYIRKKRWTFQVVLVV